MLEYINRNTELVKKDKLATYSKVQLDVLWYLMDLCKVNRIVSKESIREFLIRFFLITDAKIETTAMEYIDDGILIAGTIKDEAFIFEMKDLINLIGYTKSTSKYNVHGTLSDFCANYIFKAPNVKIAELNGEEGISISKDAFIYAMLGLETLLEIDTLNLTFKKDLKSAGEDELSKATSLADFIVAELDAKLFEDHWNLFPKYKGEFEERFFPGNIIRFDVYKDMDRANLMKIYEKVLVKEDLDKFIKLGTSDLDFIADLSFVNEHIVFAYGVKHGHIKLSNSHDSFFHDYSPYFDIDGELLKSPEDYLLSSQEIYDDWAMEEWIPFLT